MSAAPEKLLRTCCEGHDQDLEDMELGAAWREAVEALPEAWWIQLDGDGHHFRVQAGEPMWGPDYKSLLVEADSPTLALQALTERLRQ